LQNKGKISYLEFKKEYVDIQLNPLDFTKREKNITEMNAKELKNNISFKNKTGVDTTGDSVRYYMRFAIPFASLIFTILGVSIGIKPQRSSSTIGFGLSLIIIIIYYILISLSMYLGLLHILPPILAAWTPNIVIFSAGFFLLNRMAY
jgi:lipopolysaccharide export system permease protein